VIWPLPRPGTSLIRLVASDSLLTFITPTVMPVVVIQTVPRTPMVLPPVILTALMVTAAEDLEVVHTVAVAVTKCQTLAPV
jgi:hypothetical protein